MVGCRSFMLQIYQAQPSLPRPICQCSGSEKDDWPSMRLLIKVTFLILSAKLFWRFRKGIESLFVILLVSTLTFASKSWITRIDYISLLGGVDPCGQITLSVCKESQATDETHISKREGCLESALIDLSELRIMSMSAEVFFNQVGKLQWAFDSYNGCFLNL